MSQNCFSSLGIPSDTFPPSSSPYHFSVYSSHPEYTEATSRIETTKQVSVLEVYIHKHSQNSNSMPPPKTPKTALNNEGAPRPKTSPSYIPYLQSPSAAHFQGVPITVPHPDPATNRPNWLSWTFLNPPTKVKKIFPPCSELGTGHESHSRFTHDSPLRLS
jgi:hypothetical protein